MKKIAAVLALCIALPALADSVVAGAGDAKTSEWLVTNTAGGSTLTSLSARRAILLANYGPNAIYCTFGPYTPLATGALGIKIDAGATFSVAAAETVTVRCIAATAAQVTTAATQVVELR